MIAIATPAVAAMMVRVACVGRLSRLCVAFVSPHAASACRTALQGTRRRSARPQGLNSTSLRSASGFELDVNLLGVVALLDLGQCAQGPLIGRGFGRTEEAPWPQAAFEHDVDLGCVERHLG